MTPEETLDWLAQQHFDQCREERPIQDWIRKMKSQLPEQPEQEPRTAEEKLVRMKSELAYMRKSQPAVAEQHKQEPVAWMSNAGGVVTDDNGCDDWYCIPLYTTPPPVPEAHKRKPLTDEEIEIIDRAICGDREFCRAFVRVIEAEHGITASEAEDSARSKT